MSEPAFPPPALRQIAQDVSKLLKEQGATVSVAETAAGGLISAALLSMPGASKYYNGGVTVYSLSSRIAYSGWKEENLSTYKGPTPDLVAGLADHTRSQLGSTYTIGESGTAGPAASGEGRNRQPGYVALAISSEKGTFRKDVETGKTGREENMVAFAVIALTYLKEVLEGRAKL